ncbi:PD-(D/E)XK nuclease family protein [Methylibium petroleiphilum]|uniref:PD-(D/E)XK nuclease family protein n=1 Tax=Methylibium petroleiphilum TaxID=105560 RepID=UPI001ACF3322|nr:PD-(D/E)XK nuclease family protein [Methylibium petroleiphilum]MBN9203252.1 PD-(D/E)XK nuclease family protein [Methylibium petroleiphilum]
MPPEAGLAVAACWTRLVREIAAFSRREALASRDVVVLLPFAQHLPLARAAWLALDHAPWMPRFETTQTLLRSLGPPQPASSGELAFDPVTDPLQAAQLLREQVPDWPHRDPRGFALAVARLNETAQALARAKQALPPAQRAAWLEKARLLLSGATGPGQQERALARLALEWSNTAATMGSDALHALRPAAWVALRVGASDPLVESLLAASSVPVLWLDADLHGPRLRSAPGAVQVSECDDFEDEAQRAAAQVLDHLAQGEQPVALVALDRVLLRRVRALLERQQVPVSDETGWKLSTTRAGAAVMGLLRAVHPRAATDDLLDWLASAPAPVDGRAALDAAWRRDGITALRQVDEVRLEPAALALWRQWLAIGEPLSATRRLALGEWLARLREALLRAGLWEALLRDAAGRQVIDALRCRAEPAAGSAWAQQAAHVRFDADGLRDWVDGVLEAVSFEPPSPGLGGAAPVILTPLARAVLRPFAAVVCPGADAAHLGALPKPQALLGDVLAAELGLPSSAQRREHERRAFAQLLRVPRLTLLHRRRDGAEPLQASPLLLQLQFDAREVVRSGGEPRTPVAVVPRPLAHPLPVAPALLPDSLNATAYEALRACPYRFFAQRLLGLAEAEELDDAVDKRDYGTWLHAVLQDFHRQRQPGAPQDDAALLLAIARARQALLARDDADFLPFAVWFENLLPRYLAWWHAEEALGANVIDTELELRAQPPALAAAGLRLRGTLDRIDAVPGEGGQGAAHRILDYKTTSETMLRERLRQPLEDTQLPFYAALLDASRGIPPGGVQAAYLSLDGRDDVKLLAHPDVADSAAILLEGIVADFTRLQAGAPMPALGEGSACEHCSARGLCRRDHWREDRA